MDISSFKITEELIGQQPMVYARRTGPYGAENAILLEKFKAWADRQGYLTSEAVLLSVAQDDMTVVSPDACRYDVILLGDYDTEEDWIQSGTLPDGRYAVLELPHTPDAVKLVWKEGIPLLSRQYRLDFSRPIIERYQKKLVDNHLCEMLFPIL